MSTHEDFGREHEIVRGSDRAFGLVFAGVFTIVAVYPLRHGAPPRWWALGLAGVFLVISLLRPTTLQPLNRLWAGVGLLIGRVVNPIVLGLLFFLVVTPTAWLMRLAGKDPLRIRADPAAASYWVERDPPGPDPASMKKQF